MGGNNEMRNLNFVSEDAILKSNRDIVLLKIEHNDVLKIIYELIDKDNDSAIYRKKKIRYINGAINGLDEIAAKSIDMGFLHTLDYSIHIDIRENIKDGYKYPS